MSKEQQDSFRKRIRNRRGGRLKGLEQRDYLSRLLSGDSYSGLFQDHNL